MSCSWIRPLYSVPFGLWMISREYLKSLSESFTSVLLYLLGGGTIVFETLLGDCMFSNPPPPPSAKLFLNLCYLSIMGDLFSSASRMTAELLYCRLFSRRRRPSTFHLKAKFLKLSNKVFLILHRDSMA